MNKLYIFDRHTPDCEYDLVIADSLEKAIEFHSILYPNIKFNIEQFRDQIFIRYVQEYTVLDNKKYYNTWTFEIKWHELHEGIL